MKFITGHMESEKELIDTEKTVSIVLANGLTFTIREELGELRVCKYGNMDDMIIVKPCAGNVIHIS